MLKERMDDLVYRVAVWTVIGGGVALWLGALYIVLHFVIKYW